MQINRVGFSYNEMYDHFTGILKGTVVYQKRTMMLWKKISTWETWNISVAT